MSGDRYKSGGHLPRVKSAAKVRMGEWQVLSALCDRSEYDRPEVTITKNQIHEITGLERKAIQRGLAGLREKGVIVPTQGFAGGKGVAVTYSLVIVGQGDNSQPQGESGAGDYPSFTQWQHEQGGIKRNYGDYLSDKKRYEKNSQ